MSDFTDRECRLEQIEHTIASCDSDLVIVDHADDVLSHFSNDPAVTRHSLRAVYMSLKQMATRYEVPI